MMYSNVIVGITIFRGSFMFSQSRVKVPASLTNVGSLAVGAFDHVVVIKNRGNICLKLFPLLRGSSRTRTAYSLVL